MTAAFPLSFIGSASILAIQGKTKDGQQIHKGFPKKNSFAYQSAFGAVSRNQNEIAPLSSANSLVKHSQNSPAFRGNQPRMIYSRLNPL
jgi:hypothetical protein